MQANDKYLRRAVATIVVVLVSSITVSTFQRGGASKAGDLTAAQVVVPSKPCEVRLVPISNITVNCPTSLIPIPGPRATKTAPIPAKRTLIKFVVDATREAGKIEITQFSTDSFKIESFLGGSLMVSSTYNKGSINSSQTPVFLQRIARDDVGLQGLITVLARKEVVTRLFECSKTIASGCTFGCRVAGALMKAACAGATVAGCNPYTSALTCGIGVGASAVCVGAAGELEAGCIRDCNPPK